MKRTVVSAETVATTNMTGFLGKRPGVKLLESGAHGRNEDARIHDARGFCLAHKRLQLETR